MNLSLKRNVENKESVKYRYFYYSIAFDETEMVRIPVWCYQNDVGSVDVFRYNTDKENINILEKERETMIKCFHKTADSNFDDAYTRILCYFWY